MEGVLIVMVVEMCTKDEGDRGVNSLETTVVIWGDSFMTFFVSRRPDLQKDGGGESEEEFLGQR